MKTPKGWKLEPLSWGVEKLESGISENGLDRTPEGGESAVLRVSAVTSGTFLPESCKVLPSTICPKQRTPVRGDCVLINRANGSANLVGISVYVSKPYPNRFLPDKIWQIVARKDRACGRFLWAVTSTPRFREAVLNESSGGTGMRNIGSARYLGIEVAFPPLHEQRKIADILGTWDEALEKLDALIAAKALRKQALMQQLLAVAAQKIGHGHARHRLGEVVERVTRKNTVGNDNVLTISAQDGLINQREYFNRSVAGADLSGYFLLQRGEFAYNRSSSIGFPYGAIKRLDRYDAGVVSTLYLCFRIRDTTKVSSDYFAHYLDGGFINAGLRSVAKEGARAHGLLNITADEFMDIDIFIPPHALQTKIAAVLDTADAELRLLRQQRTALDHQKRGLMQQLLTGKVRVVA